MTLEFMHFPKRNLRLLYRLLFRGLILVFYKIWRIFVLRSNLWSTRIQIMATTIKIVYAHFSFIIKSMYSMNLCNSIGNATKNSSSKRICIMLECKIFKTFVLAYCIYSRNIYIYNVFIHLGLTCRFIWH